MSTNTTDFNEKYSYQTIVYIYQLYFNNFFFNCSYILTIMYVNLSKENQKQTLFEHIIPIDPNNNINFN